MSKKMQSRAMYDYRDTSSVSSAEGELGFPLSDTEENAEETTTKTDSDVGSLVDDLNSFGVNSDQAVGSVGRSNASTDMTSVPTPQRERRRRRLEVDTNTPSGRTGPLTLPFDDESTTFSPLSRKRIDDSPQFPTIQSVTSMSDSSGTGIERSISREQFYQNTMRKKKEAKRKKSIEAAGAGDESDLDSDLSFDGDDDDGVVDELTDETTPWIYDTDKDYTEFLRDISNAYVELQNRPDLQKRIINHLETIRQNIPQDDEQRVNQLNQILTFLHGVQTGMIPYPDYEQDTTIGSKRKRGGQKRRTRKHKNARGGGACMSTGRNSIRSSHVFPRKKVHWDTGKIRSESGKTPHTIDSIEEFKRNHNKTSSSDKAIFGFKEWSDCYSRGGGKSKKTTKRRKVTKRRKTIKRKPRKKTYKKKRQTKRRSTRRRR